MLIHPCDPDRLLARIRSGAKREAIVAALDAWLSDPAPKFPGLVVELIEAPDMPGVGIAIRMRAGGLVAEHDVTAIVARARAAEVPTQLEYWLDQVHWRLVLAHREAARRGVAR